MELGRKGLLPFVYGRFFFLGGDKCNGWNVVRTGPLACLSPFAVMIFIEWMLPV